MSEVLVTANGHPKYIHYYVDGKFVDHHRHMDWIDLTPGSINEFHGQKVRILYSLPGTQTDPTVDYLTQVYTESVTT